MSRKTTYWAGLLPVLICTAGLLAMNYSTLRADDPPPAAAAASAVDSSPPAAEASSPKPEEKPEDKPAETTPPAAAAPIDPGAPLNETNYALDNMMLFLCAVLVIFMQAGFALVETGLNAAKNAVNIMFKNYMDFVIGALLFFLVGYGMMYPGDTHIIPNVFGFAQVGIPTEGPTPTAAKLHPMADFLFQVAFCATAATIVSGSVAGRIKFSSYLIYTAVISGFIYPVSGFWMWGKGFLFDMGLKDFAGSLVVHTVGGMAGLAGAIALGPRIGKFVNGKAMPMPGHNLPFACLGVFILIIGWYGFNPGSQLAFAGAANTNVVMLIAVNTTLAACTGSLAGMIVSWVLFKKPDLTFALNGGLAGLVGITANCHCVTTWESLLIGAIAGVIVCLGVLMLDKLKIDDPVGAFPVHGLGGMWGGIATGIFGDAAVAGFSPDAPLTLSTQIIGTLIIAGWALSTSLVLFFGLKMLGLLRVHKEEELAGLDISEHGMYAYPPNMVVDTYGTSPVGVSYSAPPEAMASAKPSTEAV